MNSELSKLVRYRLDRANETLKEARLLFDNGYLHAAVNRLYYACFYAVSSLLLTEGRSSARHRGIMALFDEHWIKPGRVEVQMGRFYRRLFDQRQKGDYDDLVAFAVEDVANWLKESDLFISRISEQIQKIQSDEIHKQ